MPMSFDASLCLRAALLTPGLVYLCVSDVRRRILPNAWTLGGLAVGLALSAGFGGMEGFLDSLEAAGCGVSIQGCMVSPVYVYDNLFTVPDPDVGDRNFLDFINPHSLDVLTGCKAEKSLANAVAPQSFQFMRIGYFCVDSKDSAPDHLVFNRSVSLKDGFRKK